MLYTIIVKGETPRQIKAARQQRAAERRGVKLDGYTEYGYELDGIEYATVDEAYEDQQ
jgi:hypothetical protein